MIKLLQPLKYFLLILVLTSSPGFVITRICAQGNPSAKEILSSSLVQALTSRGILNSSNDKHEKEANSKLTEFITQNFSLNPNLLSKSVIYKDPMLKSVSVLGTYLYENSLPNNMSDFESKISLYGLSNGKLFSIVDPKPGNSNFNIYYTLNDLLAKSGNISADTKVFNFINAKVRIASEYQSSRKSQFTGMVGTFSNYLVEAFNRFKASQIDNDDIDIFMNLFEMYKIGILNPSSNYFIIGSADLLAYSYSDNNTFGNSRVIDGSVGANATFPWARVSGSGKYKWSKDFEMGVNSNDFNIYFIGMPTPYQVPTLGQLVTAWNAVNVSNSGDYSIDDNSLVFGGPEKVVRQITFGPFSDFNKNQLKLVSVDVASFKSSLGDKKDILLHDRTRIAKSSKDDLAQVSIEFTPNYGWINNQPTSDVEANATITIKYYDLIQSHQMQINAAAFGTVAALPKISKPKNDGNNYEWNFDILVENLPQTINPNNISGSIKFPEERISKLMSAANYAAFSTITYDSYDAIKKLVKFKATISMNLPLDQLDPKTDTDIKVLIPIVIKYKNKASDAIWTSINREVSATLSGVVPTILQRFKTYIDAEKILVDLKDDINVTQSDGTSKPLSQIRNDLAGEPDLNKRKPVLNDLLKNLNIPFSEGTFFVPTHLLK